MQIDEFAQRIARLPAALNEVFVRREILMERFGVRTGDHATTQFFQTVPQLNVFHTVKEKLFIESAGLDQQLTVRRHISRVVVREIHWTAGNAVRIKNSFVAEIAEKRICRVIPWRHNGSNDRA